MSMLLITPGSRLVLENPGYPGIMARYSCGRGVTRPEAPVDDDGIVPEDWDGEVLSRHAHTAISDRGCTIRKRQKTKLLGWASRRDAIIVEDDYDSELRWNGRPVEPLKALDRDHRVVYIGTFSKTMFVNLRIGYVVLPESLVETFRRAKSSDRTAAFRHGGAAGAGAFYDVRRIREAPKKAASKLRTQIDPFS